MKIKQETKATIRCIPLDSDMENGTCIYSGKLSNQRVLFAKAYQSCKIFVEEGFFFKRYLNIFFLSICQNLIDEMSF